MDIITIPNVEKKIFTEILKIYGVNEKSEIGLFIKKGYFYGLNDSRNKKTTWSYDMVNKLAFTPEKDPGIAGQHAEAIGYFTGILEYFDFFMKIEEKKEFLKFKQKVGMIEIAIYNLKKNKFKTKLFQNMIIMAYNKISPSFKSEKLINNSKVILDEVCAAMKRS